MTANQDEQEDSTYRTRRTDKAGLRAGILEARALVAQATDGIDTATLENEIIAGEWTPRDIIGHLADWDNRTRSGIQHALNGTDPSELVVDDFDPLNGQMAAARRARGDRWEDVTRDLDSSLAATLALLDSLGEEQLTLPASLPWGRMTTLLDVFGVFEFHVEEHHADLTVLQSQAKAAAVR